MLGRWLRGAGVLGLSSQGDYRRGWVPREFLVDDLLENLSETEMINCGVFRVGVHGVLSKAMRFTKGPKCSLFGGRVVVIVINSLLSTSL